MSILKVNEIRPRTTGASVDFTVPLGVKSYTTTERDALSSLSAGELIYNSTNLKFYSEEAACLILARQL